MACFSLRQLFASGFEAAKPSIRTEYFMLVVAMCFVALLDISDVAFAFVGALAFLTYGSVTGAKGTSQAAQPRKVACSSTHVPSQKPLETEEPRYVAVRRERRERNMNAMLQTRHQKCDGAENAAELDTTTVSVCPVMCPSLSSMDWEGQVTEFLCELVPSDETGALARTISCAVQDALRSAFPNVEVAGFAHGNPKSSKAFATAVPDVEIVAKMDPKDMTHGIGARHGCYDAKSLQKAVIRACTDQLAYGEFKFRRSSFKYDEPKVTLQAPVALECIPFDFSVNSLTPMRHDLLLRACSDVDIRAWELTLLVHRWARDRGISHAAKGHLTPYAWTLVVLFYLQVREQGEGPLMPAFTSSPPHLQQTCRKSKKARSAEQPPRTPVSTLFKEFMKFFATKFDWRREVLSVKKASRVVLAPEKDVVEWRRQAAGLEISDPFEPSSNLANLLSNEGRARLREELSRADAICSKDGLLSELLEPWSPADSAPDLTKTINEEPKVKNDVFPKPSLRGSLTASPVCLSLRPSGPSRVSGSKVSLTASPQKLQLKPRGAHKGSSGSETETTQSGASTSAASSESE